MKYIYIDSNQYRHLFSVNQGFSDELVSLLCNLAKKDHIKILMPKQTKDEIERNRFSAWHISEAASLKESIDKLNKKIENLDKEYGQYEKGISALKRAIGKEIKIKQKAQLNLDKIFLNKKSRQNQSLKKIFAACVVIEESEELAHRAELRFKKRNPPYDVEKFGDALIWESLLEYLKNSGERGEKQLLIVSNDKKAWGSDSTIDQWLKDEFRGVIKNSEVVLINKLAAIPDFTEEERRQIENEEIKNLKLNIINDFCNSTSFVGAGESASKLLEIKDFLDKNDYENILMASVKNPQIYQSFFVPSPLLNTLYDNGVLKNVVHEVDAKLWESFCLKYDFNITQRPIIKPVNNVVDFPF